MDSYAEYMVVKPSSAADTIKKTAIIVLGGILILLLVFLSLTLMPMLLLLVCGVWFGCYYLLSGFRVEYEYLVTNGELDVDKIQGKRKRTRLITVKVSSFESFQLEQTAQDPREEVTWVLAGDDSENTYCADFNHEDLGRVRLVFSPNERVLEEVQKYLRASVRQQTEK